MKVSLISTVKDASAHVEEFIGSVAAQTRAPDEVIVVDGGSTDGTPDLLRRAGVEGTTVIEERGANIARGRNVAIAAAAHDVIAVTDADCVLDPRWLERILEPIEAGADVSMGFYAPITDGFLQECLASVNLPLDASEVDPASFMPSARSVAFRRDAIEAAGGYPEWLAIGEDMWVNRRWRELGLDMRFAPDAVVRWRLRPTMRATWTQYFRYARGDAQAGMFPERHALRFGVYAGGTAALASRRRWPKVLAAAGAVAYAREPVRRAWRRMPDAARAGRGGGRRARADGMDRLREDGRLRGRAGRPRTRRVDDMRRTLIVACSLALLTAGLVGSVGSPATARGDGTIRLHVMTFNIREGGVHGRFSKVVEAIRKADADVVGLQEPFGRTRKLARALGWYAAPRLHTISRFPILQPAGSDGFWGWLLVAPGQGRHDREHPQPVVSLHRQHDAAGHGDARPRSCRSNGTSACDGCSRSWTPSRRSSRPALPCSSPATSTPRRGATGRPRSSTRSDGSPRPSRYRAPRFSVRWPTSLVMEDAGFRDSFREVRPDAIAEPGFTWTSGHPGISPWDVFDRIDFVWAAGSSETLSSRVVGDDDPMSDVVVEPWPSDHRAVVSTFDVTPADAPAFVVAARRARADRPRR